MNKQGDFEIILCFYLFFEVVILKNILMILKRPPRYLRGDLFQVSTLREACQPFFFTSSTVAYPASIPAISKSFGMGLKRIPFSVTSTDSLSPSLIPHCLLF